MQYTSVITSKGTITLPAEFRQHLGLTAGTRVAIDRTKHGTLDVKRLPDLTELRQRNAAALGTQGRSVIETATANDAGFAQYVQEKHGAR